VLSIPNDINRRWQKKKLSYGNSLSSYRSTITTIMMKLSLKVANDPLLEHYIINIVAVKGFFSRSQCFKKWIRTKLLVTRNTKNTSQNTVQDNSNEII
jgi:hypothetical protein